MAPTTSFLKIPGSCCQLKRCHCRWSKVYAGQREELGVVSGKKRERKEFCGRRKYQYTHLILSHARYSNSILNVRGSNEGSEGFVRRINTGINVMDDILPSPPPSACPYLQEILLSTNLVPPFIGRIPRIIAGDKQTALLTGYRGGEERRGKRIG